MAIKQVSVTFEFDSETELVSNVHAFVDGIEKKKTTTKKKKKEDEEEVMEDVATITREETKLVLNNKAMADMELAAEDRIIIKYEQIAKGKKKFPVIGSDISWNEEGSGNKITKGKSVAFRGKNNLVLAEYGTTFTLEPYKDGLWKLISLTQLESGGPVSETYEDVVDEAEKLDVTIITEDDDTTQIDELTFNLTI